MRPAELSNLDLVRVLARAGPDDPAWLEFVSRFHGQVRRVVYRAFVAEAARFPGADASRPGEAVEDLAQEVFLRLLDGERRALLQFRGQSERSFPTYLSAIACNLVRDHFKKLRAQRRPPAATSLSEPVRGADGPTDVKLADLLPTRSLDPEATALASERNDRLAQALEQVSHGTTSMRDRLIFRLYFIEGLTLDEISSLGSVGLSVSGVEKRLRKMRTAVKEFLTRDDLDGRPAP